MKGIDMELLKSKIVVTDNRYNTLLPSLFSSHKFELSIEEVFGRNFKCEGVYEWVTNHPDETMNWLRLPHSPMYIEYPDMFNSGVSITAYGLLLTETNGLVQINPIKVHKGLAIFQPMTIKLGITRKINKEDFRTVSSRYEEWKTNWGPLCDYRVLGIIHGEVEKHLQASILSSIPVLLESLLYINSKGIGTTVNYHKAKKRTKRKSAFTDWTFKTLRVIKKGDPKEIVNRTLSSKKRIPFLSREGRETSVCGHIAFYTEDSPRFGYSHKSNIGPHWISPHVRNKGTEGKIIKNYKVV
jgi:hypothetical protein